MRLASLLLSAALLAAAADLRAAPADDATKDAARKMAQEGLDLFDSGKYKEALDRFVRADALFHAPTMLLMAARSLEKLGRLVEAAEKYGAASQVILDAHASDAFRAAVKDAEKERAALLERVPSIVMIVDAPAGADVQVSLDGSPIPAASLGEKRLIDPGAHTLEASAGDAKATSRVEVKEGESRTVHLDLMTGAPSSSPARSVGLVTLGLGAAGVIAGAITAGVAAAKNDELRAACGTDGVCPRAQEANLAAYEALKTASSAGLIGGGALVVVGAAMVVFAPRSAAAPQPAAGVRWSPWVGLGAVGIKGVF